MGERKGLWGNKGAGGVGGEEEVHAVADEVCEAETVDAVGLVEAGDGLSAAERSGGDGEVGVRMVWYGSGTALELFGCREYYEAALLV